MYFFFLLESQEEALRKRNTFVVLFEALWVLSLAQRVLPIVPEPNKHKKPYLKTIVLENRRNFRF